MLELGITLENLDPVLTAISVYNSSLLSFKDTPPYKLNVDDESKKFTQKWIEKLTDCDYSVSLFWGKEFSYDKTFTYKKDGALGFSIENFWDNIQQVVDVLQPLPWTVATLSSIHRSWFGQEINYAPPGFSYLHAALGWGCAFKGDGHKRVVSRRYLEYGPWHVIRDEANDITLIQFHDLNADPLTALEQAKPGHQLMGHPFEGGFMQRDYQIANELSGIYTPEERKLTYTVNQRPVTKSELLDVCATRLWQLLGADKPVERVSYLFIYEEDARKHLHDLWLREIECWAFIDGLPVRLDENYTPPPPEKPEWVQQLETPKTKQTTRKKR
jgi:hypothetical protein